MLPPMGRHDCTTTAKLHTEHAEDRKELLQLVSGRSFVTGHHQIQTLDLRLLLTTIITLIQSQISRHPLEVNRLLIRTITTFYRRP